MRTLQTSSFSFSFSRTYLPAPYLYLPHVAARVRRTGFRATISYFKNQGYTLDQALYLFAGRNTLTTTTRTGSRSL